MKKLSISPEEYTGVGKPKIFKVKVYFAVTAIGISKISNTLMFLNSQSV